MPFSTDPSSPATLSPEQTQQEHPFSAQHSRTNSIESTSTDYNPTTGAKESKLPDMVRRDMEFFMARLTRTNSNDSTKSR